MNDPAVIPDVTLERYRLHELPAADATRVEHLLATDPALAHRLAALQESDAAIRVAFPSAALAAGIAGGLSRDAAGDRPSMLDHLRWALPAAAVALLALLVVWPETIMPSLSSRGALATDTDRIKGVEATLAIYRRTDAGSELLTDGARAHIGDLLRIGYKVADTAYGVIVSVDGRGLVTLHLPADGGRAVPLERGDTVLLDRAYELDDAPKWERFYLVTGRTAFDVEPVLTALRKASPTNNSATLSLGPDLGQVTFVLQKDTRP